MGYAANIHQGMTASITTKNVGGNTKGNVFCSPEKVPHPYPAMFCSSLSTFSLYSAIMFQGLVLDSSLLADWMRDENAVSLLHSEMLRSNSGKRKWICTYSWALINVTRWDLDKDFDIPLDSLLCAIEWESIDTVLINLTMKQRLIKPVVSVLLYSKDVHGQLIILAPWSDETCGVACGIAGLFFPFIAVQCEKFSDERRQGRTSCMHAGYCLLSSAKCPNMVKKNK